MVMVTSPSLPTSYVDRTVNGSTSSKTKKGISYKSYIRFLSAFYFSCSLDMSFSERYSNPKIITSEFSSNEEYNKAGIALMLLGRASRRSNKYVSNFSIHITTP